MRRPYVFEVIVRRGEALPRPSFDIRGCGLPGDACVAPTNLRWLFVGARHCLALFRHTWLWFAGRRMRRPYEFEVIVRRGEALPRPVSTPTAVVAGRRMRRPYEQREWRINPYPDNRRGSEPAA